MVESRIECWFSILTRKRLKNVDFTSVKKLELAIELWAEHWNDNPTPSVWLKTAEDIIARTRRGRATLNTLTNSLTDHWADAPNTKEHVTALHEMSRTVWNDPHGLRARNDRTAKTHSGVTGRVGVIGPAVQAAAHEREVGEVDFDGVVPPDMSGKCA